MVTTPTFWGSEVIFSSASNTGASKVTGLQDGNFAIVWGDSLGDIHGRRFDALGNFNSTDFLFNMSQATTQEMRLPELIQNGDGTTGVYFNLTASAADGDIYINAPDFDTVGGRTGKATVADRPYDEFMRDVAATEINNTPATAVLINTPRGTTGISDLYLAYTTTGGLIYGSPQIVPIGAGETVVDASVTGLPNGNTLVAYHTAKISTGEHFVRYRVYDDYTDLTGQREASSTPGNDAFPAVTALSNSSDGFVIVTQDALGLRFLYNGFGQTFTKSVPGTLSSGGGGFAKAIAPEVTALDDGGFIVAWTDTTEREGDNSPALKIGLQRFDRNANAVGDNVFINAPGDQSLESIATLDDGRVILTYSTETGDSTGVTRLAYQIIDPRDATIYGSTRAETIVSREDGAHIIAGAGGDTLLGRAGADILNGESGADTMRGYAGNDTFVVDNAGDQVMEAAGGGTADRVNASVSYTLAAGQQIEILGTTSVAGTAAINLTGNSFAQTIYGNAGANTLNGAGGADTLQGFGGSDTYVVDVAGDRVFEAANAGTDRVNASVSYTLAAGQQIETLSTTSAAGTTAINLTGNSLAQTIYGNAGANILNGKAGADSLVGRGGSDTFVFDTALGAGNVDHITDFSAPADTIRLDKTIFSALSAGTLAPSAYKDIGNPGAVVDASDRILYNDDTGALFYDSNGSAAGGRLHFATLDTMPATLTGADFFVVA